MSAVPQVRVIRAIPLGAKYDAEDGTVGVAFVLENGDHLHILLSKPALKNLSRDIVHIRTIADEYC